MLNKMAPRGRAAHLVAAWGLWDGRGHGRWPLPCHGDLGRELFMEYNGTLYRNRHSLKSFLEMELLILSKLALFHWQTIPFQLKWVHQVLHLLILTAFSASSSSISPRSTTLSTILLNFAFLMDMSLDD